MKWFCSRKLKICSSFANCNIFGHQLIFKLWDFNPPNLILSKGGGIYRIKDIFALAYMTEIEKVCGEQDSVILLKDSTIKNLRSKLDEQTKAHRHELSDQDIHLQQERYLTQHHYTQTSATKSDIKKRKRWDDEEEANHKLKYLYKYYIKFIFNLDSQTKN